MSPSSAALRVDRFSASFGAGPILQDVSLTLERGEAMALIGESGAGKSLLCRSICGINDAHGLKWSGVIELGGRPVDPRGGESMRSLWGRRVTMVFQDPRACLNPVQRIGAQLEETLRLHHPLSRAQTRRRALELLAEVELPDPAGCALAYPHELSGGMCQRVAIAMALSPGPEVLVADEPTSALDAVRRRAILNLLAERCRSAGTALLLVTHDLAAARTIANRAVVLYAGEVVEAGPAEAVLSAPAHPYTAALLRCAPTLAARGGGLESINGTPPAAGQVRTGCPFAPRCPHAFDACSQQRPTPREAGDSLVACLLHPEDARA